MTRTRMRSALAVLAVLAAAALAPAAEPRSPGPFETKGRFERRNAVDDAVGAELRRRRIEPANPCSDEVFLRRAHLDVIGTLPRPDEVHRFLGDRSRDKRRKLVEELLRRDEYADYWSLRWCDALRVKAEFPINLWPNAVQAYHRWIRDAMKENLTYDRFVRALLTSSGSNFRVPPVNFYRAVQSREPEGIARAVALTFMGTRLESWPPSMRAGMGAFFSRVGYKPTREWKEEIILALPGTGYLEAELPDGVVARIAPDEDPRKVFADWLIRPDNPWFARSLVNRVWAWLMGRGIVHEPDDFRAGNPPSNPELLDVLAREFVESGYDLRALIRLILDSSTYQQSPIPQSEHPEAEALFAHYIVRQLDAEVLIDALCQLTGTAESYMSPIPEPFTFVPEEQRTIQLADGSISSPFLEMFGRPARDTGLMSERNLEPTAGQRLHLLNSRDVQRRIGEGGGFFRVLRGRREEPGRALDNLYVAVLSRLPTPGERAAAEKYVKESGLDLRRAAADLAWALINTKEFLYRH